MAAYRHAHKGLLRLNHFTFRHLGGLFGEYREEKNKLGRVEGGMYGWRTCWIKVKKVKVKRFWKRIEPERTLNPVKRKSPDFSLASTKLHRTFLALSRRIPSDAQIYIKGTICR